MPIAPRRVLKLFLVVTAALVGACEAPVGTVLFPAPGADPPPYGAVPFPSDAYLERGRIGAIPDLKKAVPFEFDALQAHLSALDGFSTRPTIEIFVDAPIDVDTLADGVFVIGLSDGADRDVVMPWLWRWDAERMRVAGAPARGTVLEERQRYAVVVTDALRAEGGRLAPSEGFEALRAAESDTLPSRWRSTRDAVDAAARLFGPSRVIAVSAFTVQSARTPLLRARAMLDALPPPRIAFPEPAFIYDTPARLDALMGTAPRHDDGERAGDEQIGWGLGSGLAHDHVGVVASGVLSGVSFRRADLRGDAGFGPQSGTFDVDDDGAPRVVSEQHIPVTFALPASAPPPDGYPIAIFGHGLGASRVQALAFAETLAREGWAVAAIDASGHGSRFNADDDDNNVGKLMTTFTGVSAMADGFGDVEGIGTAFELFHEMRNIAAMRDEMRQSVLDLSQLVLALKSDALDLRALGPDARVDASRLVYLGESFGSVLGGVFAAVEPHVRTFVLDVPGGGILDMMACHAPQLRAMVTLYVPSLYGVDGDTLDRFHPLIGFGNALLDPADPLSYARHVLRDRPRIGGVRLPPRDVVLIMAEGDEVLANSGTIALAKTLEIPMLAPHTTTHGLASVDGPVAGNVDGQTAAVIQQAPATHGRNWTEVRAVRKVYPFDLDDIVFEPLEESVPVTNPVEETHDQLRRMLREIAGGRTPTIEATPAPVEDFDDDGVLDADDETPFGY